MTGRTQRSAAHALQDDVLSALAANGDLEPGEVVTHFDLVVETRVIDDEGAEHIRRHHWSPLGSSPHLSFGILAAESGRIMRNINSGV